MAQKYPFIKVNMTQDEKDKIENLARQHKMSTSAFVKSQLSSILAADEPAASAPFNYEAEGRDIRIEIRVSEREMETIKANAGVRTIAAYVRDAALNGSKIIKVEVYDDDIVELIHRVQPRIDSIFGVVKALQMQQQLHDNQYARLESLLNEISKDIRGTVSSVRKNRNSIRQTRLRELRRRCNDAIKNNTDSLASFAADEDANPLICTCYE